MTDPDTTVVAPDVIDPDSPEMQPEITPDLPLEAQPGWMTEAQAKKTLGTSRFTAAAEAGDLPSYGWAGTDQRCYETAVVQHLAST